jgi:predicted GIY-YIG superfamily endonuclease
MEEQHEIVAEIEKQFTRLEAGVAGLRRVQANLKRYRAAVLKAACEGKLVPTEASLRRAEHGRQAELARQEGRALPAPRPGVFFVYAIRCDNDSIYIGHTQDLQKRWREHLAGQGADWATQHKPVLIVHYEECASREEAVAREKWLKTGFGRKWIKREIAAGRLPAHEAGARQAGYETGAQLLERILSERRQKWSGKGKYKEPAVSNAANLPGLPGGWEWATVEQLAVVVRGASPRPAGDPKYFGGNVPWITVGPITADSKAYLDSVPESVTEEGRERSRYVEPQTLLLTNSGATLGVPKITLIGGCINDGVAALLDVDYPLKLYLLYFLHSQTKNLRGMNQGAAQPNLNTSIIKAINVPLPPVAEQGRIVAEVERHLSVVEELESIVNANLQRATRLRQSILQQAFEGKLVQAKSDGDGIAQFEVTINDSA